MASAQCATQWLPGEGLPGIHGTVHASTMWDPDGPGPAASVLVAGGSFEFVGNARLRGIATYDLASGVWSALGSGPGSQSDTVYALAVMPNNERIGGASSVLGQRPSRGPSTRTSFEPSETVQECR
jgi:hypothetical protein